MHHRSYAQLPRRQVKSMSLADVFHFVAPNVREATLKAAAQLENLGIRYALAGGLAVGAHGHVQAVTAVDFLVGDEAFEQHGALVTFKPGVPIEVAGIRIDYLSPAALGAQLEATLDQPPVSDGIAVVPIEVLVYMKLVAGRRKDQFDVVELLRAGADAKHVRSYITEYAADLLPLFDELAREALTD